MFVLRKNQRLVKFLTISMASSIMIMPIGVFAADDANACAELEIAETAENIEGQDVSELEVALDGIENEEFDLEFAYECAEADYYGRIEENKIGKKKYMCNKNGVVMRSVPRNDGKQITIINKGTILVEVDNTDINGWKRVTDGTNVGYVQKKYLS